VLTAVALVHSENAGAERMNTTTLGTVLCCAMCVAAIAEVMSGHSVSRLGWFSDGST
jgi:hypothetical protein